MNEDHVSEPGALTRAGWFLWRNWNRLVCVTRGHDLARNHVCDRCGLPVPTWDEIDAYRDALERLRDPRNAPCGEGEKLAWIDEALGS